MPPSQLNESSTPFLDLYSTVTRFSLSFYPTHSAPLDEGQLLGPSDLPICHADWGSDSEPEKVYVVHPKAFAR
jgi:hypothetical protein